MQTRSLRPPAGSYFYQLLCSPSFGPYAIPKADGPERTDNVLLAGSLPWTSGCQSCFVFSAGKEHVKLIPCQGPALTPWPWEPTFTSSLLELTLRSLEPYHVKGAGVLEIFQSSDFPRHNCTSESAGEFVECRSLGPPLCIQPQNLWEQGPRICIL